MATHGKTGEFSSQREDWLAYSERLEEYFIANDIESSDKKKAILLSVVGAETYQLIRSLVAPAKPKEKTLVKLVQEHHQPIPSAIVQRYKFNSRTQQAGESIAIFVAELRCLAEHCKFGRTLDEMLRDQPVCGIADSRVQRRLLAEPDLTLKTALELAQAHEMAEKGTQQLQQRPQSSLRLGKLKRRTIVNRRHVRRNNNREIICASDVGVNMQVPADSRMLFAIIAKRKGT